MTLIDQLLSLASAYEGATGIRRTTLSWRLFADSKKLKGLFEGGDLLTKRWESSIAWFSTNWPDDLSWPQGIARPNGGGE